MKAKKQKKKRSVFRKIVNGFIIFFIVIVVLLLLFFGFSQTSTFREILRDEIVSRVESEINGHFQIDQIDGTIFTSLILRNTILFRDNDTILTAKYIKIKTSPLQLLLKKIYIRDFEINNARFSLLNSLL